jgi:uncharacterized protein (DUF1800 family)
MSLTLNKHLLWRAGFGPMTEQLNQLESANPVKIWKSLLDSSSENYKSIDVVDSSIRGLMMGMNEAGKQVRSLSDEEKRMLRVKSREGIKTLNITWLNEMIHSDQQLREKVAFFWHGHFASRNLNILYQQQLLDIIRKNALGNFAELLREVSKSASMIFFLNNNRNVKNHPNENFARELMELFTLGRGNYSETDIKEAARAFTGWNTNLKGEFTFRKFQHDNGSKTFFGKTGNFDGDEILDMILSKPQTANFIAGKFYRFFVNEIPDTEKINWLASRFYKSNYEIKQLLNDIFLSDWFYDAKNIGTRIKSPVELLAGMRRMLPMVPQKEESQMLIQRLLGQVLFYPPNVAGWPGGKNWIDSSSLMFRLKLPKLLASNDIAPVSLKDDDDLNMGKEMKQQKNAFGANIEWTDYTAQFSKVKREDLKMVMTKLLLQKDGSHLQNILSEFADESDRTSYIQSITLQLMSTPDYQLC